MPVTHNLTPAHVYETIYDKDAGNVVERERERDRERERQGEGGRETDRQQNSNIIH